MTWLFPRRIAPNEADKTRVMLETLAALDWGEERLTGRPGTAVAEMRHHLTMWSVAHRRPFPGLIR